ncbi:hypothetical protein AX15_007870 [Amanita polypyramis BW_CC]|nr:hypothetical protein AX15_007870 [Amanita polypyramis BW_CC]
MSYQSPFNFSGPSGENYSTTPTTPIEGLDFQLPQWETVEREHQQHQQQQQRLQQEQQHQQQLSHPRSHPPTPTMYQTIQLDEQAGAVPPPPPPRVVSSRMHIEGVPLHDTTHSGHGREGRSGLINTLDYSRLSPQSSDVLHPISISPTMASTNGLVSRQTRARPEPHPYKRPQSALGTKTPTIPLRQMQEGSTRRSSTAHPPSSMQAVRSASAGSSSKSTATATQRRSGPSSPNPDAFEEMGKTYIIRADVNVDLESKVFTALLELPGVRRDEVRVTLSSCRYNGVKQVTIAGRTRDPFITSSEGGQGLGKVVKERRYGRFIRTFAVSPDTKSEDIDVSMEDGILTLKINSAPTFVDPQIEEVPIR